MRGIEKYDQKQCAVISSDKTQRKKPLLLLSSVPPLHSQKYKESDGFGLTTKCFSTSLDYTIPLNQLQLLETLLLVKYPDTVQEAKCGLNNICITSGLTQLSGYKAQCRISLCRFDQSLCSSFLVHNVESRGKEQKDWRMEKGKWKGTGMDKGKGEKVSTTVHLFFSFVLQHWAAAEPNICPYLLQEQ